MWPAREAVDAWHLVSRAVHLAVVGFLTVYVFLSPLWRERSWSWALGLVGAGLWFLGAAVHLAEELFGIPQALHHWGEDVPLTLGPLLVVVRIAVLLPRLHADAHLDPLTGLLNRRGVERALRRELARARRHGLPLAVLFGDVDALKEINDARGHRAGDTLLRLVAGCLRANLRETDAAGRWSGDEFVVLLPHADAAGAEAAMRRLEASCAALPAVLAFPVSVAWGRASYPEDGSSAEDLLAAADRSMYEEKRRRKGGHPPGGVRAGPAGPPEAGARAPGEP